MVNLINKKNSYEDSPKPSKNWINYTEIKRIDLIHQILVQDFRYERFEIISAEENGYVILKIEESIDAKNRGILLLELEEMLKKTIDQGITVWLQPVGDKSKLRNLRGIEIKSEFNKT